MRRRCGDGTLQLKGELVASLCVVRSWATVATIGDMLAAGWLANMRGCRAVAGAASAVRDVPALG